MLLVVVGVRVGTEAVGAVRVALEPARACRSLLAQTTQSPLAQVEQRLALVVEQMETLALILFSAPLHLLAAGTARLTVLVLEAPVALAAARKFIAMLLGARVTRQAHHHLKATTAAHQQSQAALTPVAVAVALGPLEAALLAAVPGVLEQRQLFPAAASPMLAGAAVDLAPVVREVAAGAAQAGLAILLELLELQTQEEVVAVVAALVH